MRQRRPHPGVLAFAATAALLAARCLAGGEPPAGAVLIEVVEDIGERSWELPESARVTAEFHEPYFSLTRLPKAYSHGGRTPGVAIDRSNPHLVRATARVELPAGRWRFLLRSLNAARLLVDGRVVAETRFLTGNADGHEEVPDLPEALHPALPLLPPGHAETVADLELDGRPRLVVLEAFVGGKKLRPEIGELCVAVAPAPATVPAADTVSDAGADTTADAAADAASAPYLLLSAGAPSLRLTDSTWRDVVSAASRRLDDIDRASRAEARRRDDPYWASRHELARAHVAALPPLEVPDVSPSTPVANDIDRFIGRRLEEAGVEPAPALDDLAFLRRLSLDVRGVVPSLAEIDAFLAEPAAERRPRAIDRMLASPGWAEHWVAYWQDVLAENPGILKPQLNNTGPFRWWIRESFADRKPIDRWVTELIMMEGSRYGGAPAGFAMATQNDVPMAAKAHVIGTAFLGVEMRCARCHDAPHHASTQKDLFSLAAMLRRKPQEVPPTSSVPRSKEELARLLVTVSLSPGTEVAPAWPLGSMAPADVPESLLRDPADTRERLAALVTQPANMRFARVMANRVWKRYMGWGLVEPADDWESAGPSHPDLLEHLARELVSSGYDIEHLARLVLGSQAYGREARGVVNDAPPPAERLFAGPARRRMTAEQLVDSLFAAAGKELDSEAMNLDVDARRPIETFLDLGVPRRAWEFASLSNERDRPALAMPVAQSIVDVLETFGWRATRQDPITDRPDETTALQPLLLANGTVANRIATLSDGGALTALCLEDAPLERLVRRVYLAVLTREPRTAELELFTGLLAEGYETRVREAPAGTDRGRGRRRHAVSWSNHLNAEASRIKLELEREARRGDPPTARLAPDWRERMEDVIWALINSPEFVFVP